jgi:hypothetical protein
MTDHTSDKEYKIKKPYIKPALKPICGRIVRTMDNNRRPCLRPEGHQDGCNPFSDMTPVISPKRD